MKIWSECWHGRSCFGFIREGERAREYSQTQLSSGFNFFSFFCFFLHSHRIYLPRFQSWTDTNNFSLLSSRHCRLSCAVNFRDLCSAGELSYSSSSTDFVDTFSSSPRSSLSSFLHSGACLLIHCRISLYLQITHRELVCIINSVYWIQFINNWYESERVQEFFVFDVGLREVEKFKKFF